MVITYPDKNIRLICIPLLGLIFRHIGEPSPLIALLRSPTYYIDVAVCILVLWVLWQYNRLVIKQLDKRYPWLSSNVTERIVIQAITGIGVSLIAVTLISFVYNEFIIHKQRTPEYDITIVFVTDTPVSFLILISIHLLYALLYIREAYEGRLLALQQTSEEQDLRKEASARNIMAYQGKALVPVPVHEIAYLYKANEITLLRTFTGKEYILDETLEHFERTLPEKAFFRLNRQMLVHISSVKKIASNGTGRLLVQLEPDFKEEVYVSRRRSPEFQTWLRETVA